MYGRRHVAVLACVSAAVVISACNRPAEAPGTNVVPSATAPAGAAAPLSGDAQLERGRMLVIGGLCHDCHTPKKSGPAGPEPDFDKALSGHPESAKITAPAKLDPKSPWQVYGNDQLTAWSGAWGVSFAANITSDSNTGMGIWTEKMFFDAMRTGKHMGTSRPILPPMPWGFIGQLSDEDLKALFAYLKASKPIANRVPPPLGPDGKPIEEPQ